MATIAFQKFKALEQKAQKEDGKKPKAQKRRNLIGDLATRFENENLREERRKKEEQERLRLEKDRMEQQEKARQEQERIEQEKLEREKLEQQRRREEEEAKRRKDLERKRQIEAQRKLDEENKQKKRVWKPPCKTKQPKEPEDFKAQLAKGKPKQAPPAEVVYTRGTCSSIKGMFEENIAVKKGLKPDPTLLQEKSNAPCLKYGSNVKNNADHLLKQLQGQTPQPVVDAKKKEYIPVDKKIFNQFLSKFEDDEARQFAKDEMLKLTSRQRQYLSKDAPTWSRKQEERKRKELEEEARRIQEQLDIQILEEEMQRQREAEEADKQLRLQQEEKLRKEQEEATKLAAAAASLTNKPKKKKKKKKAEGESGQLPTLVSTTCSDLKKKFDIKKNQQPEEKNDEPMVKPRARRLIYNPFERKSESEENATVKRREFPEVKQNRISDIKKRYSQLMGTSDVPQEESKQSKKGVDQVDKKLVANEVQYENKQSRDNNSNLKKKSLLRLSIEKLNASKEKLIKHSKEKLNELSEGKEPPKPSKNDMQNYLITQVLFDGKKPAATTPKEELVIEDFDDGEEVALDEEYVKEMEKYLWFLEDKGKKKKKKKQKKKQVQPAVQIKVVEVNDIKKQFERKPVQPQKHTKNLQLPADQSVGKVKKMFETPEDAKPHQQLPPPNKRMSRMINQDLLKKFDSPEMAEQLRKQKEDEREERRKLRIQKLEEEKRKMEEMRLEAIRKEEERLEAIRQEQLRKEEEARLERERIEEETRQQAAYEEMIRLEKEKAVARQQKEAASKALREKNEPALRRKKVLGRIQHIFEKSDADDKPNVKVGSINTDNVFGQNNDGPSKKAFQDSSLAGVSSVMNKFKGKFEAKEEKPLSISRGVQIKKKVIPQAMQFEFIEKKQEEVQSPTKASETEWSWKKKDPNQLAVESTIAMYGESKKVREKSDREQKKADKQRELLADIKCINSRLLKKDAVKEHEQKMQEYAAFMQEIQEYLNEPDTSTAESNFKDDIQNYINIVGTSKRVKKKSGERPPHPKCDLDEIKAKLQGQGMDKKANKVAPDSSNVKAIKQSLVQQFFGGKKDKQAPSSSDSPSASVTRMKDLFETSGESNQESKSKSKAMVNDIKSLQVPAAFQQREEPEKHEIRKSAYEWAYKQISIAEFHHFLEDNRNMVPNAISKCVDKLASEKNDCEEVDEDDGKIVEYNDLMNEVEEFLSAPDNSTAEINFKSEVERYLDLIEDKSSPEKVDRTTAPVVRRQPKKLNINAFEEEIKRNSVYENDNECDLQRPQKESKSIKDLQNKLIAEMARPVNKEEVMVHNAGTDHLKKGYEKLQAKPEQSLLSAPKTQVQKTMDDVQAGTKTLEELKAERANTNWSWKQKTMSELHDFVSQSESSDKSSLVTMVEDQQVNMKRLDDQLNKLKANTAADITKRRQIQEQRDKDMDKFLSEVKQCIDNSVEKNGFQSDVREYLRMFEKPKKEAKAADKKNQFGEPKFGTVSNVRKMLEKEQRDSYGSLESREGEPDNKWKVGKVSTAFLEGDDARKAAEPPKPIKDPVISKVSASKVKEQLESMSSQQSHDKELSAAPKRKLKNFENVFQVQAVANNSQAHLTSFPTGDEDERLKRYREQAKLEIQKRKPEAPQSTYAHFKDEKEKKAAILAKYGFKQRDFDGLDESSSSSSDSDTSEDEVELDENNIPVHISQSNVMYAIYGDRLTAQNRSKKVHKTQDGSVASLKNILGAVRGANNPHCRRRTESEDSEDLSDIPGSCSNIRTRFEEKPTVERTPLRPRFVEKSSSCTNVKFVMESGRESHDEADAVFRVNPLNKRVLEPFISGPDDQNNSPRSSFVPGGLAKSSSYNRFKDSLEGDVVQATTTTEARMEIDAELEEIRSCPRIKKMFNISRPNNRPSALAKSASSSAIPGDGENRSFSENRSQIQNMFETPKITYGGGAKLKIAEEEEKRAKPKKSVNFDDRTWVFDAINQYFDVIVEDEEEDEESDSEEYSPMYESQVVTCTSTSRFVYPQLDNEPSDEPSEEEEVDEDDEDDEDSESEDDANAFRRQLLGSSGQIQRSTSSHRMRSLLSSVLQRSSSNDLSMFKANLGMHLHRRNSSNTDANDFAVNSNGYEVEEPSSSDDSDEYDDAVEDNGRYYTVPL